MKSGTSVFIDTGAFIALALSRDAMHDRAVATFERLDRLGARWVTSVPIVIETFTFLERNTERQVALRWKDSLDELPRFRLLECTRRDLAHAWTYFARKDLHKLSAVDATSFVLMKRERIREAFAFDLHFAVAGFKFAG